MAQKNDKEIEGDLGAEKVDRIVLDPDSAAKGLMQLVLSIVQLVKELMEKQAIRRMENGSLTDQQIEDVGRTFLALDKKLEELKTEFGLTEEDLNINLGKIENLE